MLTKQYNQQTQSNQTQPHQAQAQAQAKLQARRVDTRMAAIVDKGVQLQEVFGTKFAADYLSFHKVSIDVTVRVLTKPNERRIEPIVRRQPY